MKLSSMSSFAFAPPPAVEITPPPAVAREATILSARPASEVRQVASQALGGALVSPAEVDLGLVRAAMTRGVLTTANIHLWAPYRFLSLQDRGLSQTAKANLRGESISILPPAIRTVYAKGKSAIYRGLSESGFKVQGYKGVFIPLARWEGFLRLFNKGRDHIHSGLDMLCKDLDGYRAGLEAYVAREIVPRAWTGHRTTWSEGGSKPGCFAEVVKPTPDFVEWMQTRFSGCFPPEEEIRARTYVNYDLSVLHVPEIGAMIEEARALNALGDELRKSLERQRQDLPRVFAESVIAAVTEILTDEVEILSKAKGTGAGGLARLRTGLRKHLSDAKATNLSQDSRLVRILTDADTALRREESRADAAGGHVPLDALVRIALGALEQTSALLPGDAE